MLNYQLVQSQLSGRLIIQLVFNYPLDSSIFTAADFDLAVETSNAPTSQETDISGLRTLQQNAPPSYRIV